MNRVFKALADPTRRRVLQLLRGGPLSAGELSEHFDVSKPTMSAHFSVLQEADLIEAQKHGRTILYRLKLSVLEDALLSFAQTVGSRSPATGRRRRRARVGGSFRPFLRGTA
jgi:DNA-binding transcriptional ArsR family regulator